MSLERVLILVILAVIAVALLIWFFTDVVDVSDDGKRDAGVITRTL